MMALAVVSRHVCQERRSIAVLICCSVLGLIPNGRAVAADDGTLVISFSYTRVTSEISPRTMVHRSKVYTVYKVHKDGRIDESGSRQGKSIDESSQLGAPFKGHNYTGGSEIARISVQGGVIVKSWFTDSYKTILSIKTNGTDSCQVTYKFSLNPGHQYFEGTRMTNKEHLYMNDIHAEDPTCDIKLE